MSLTNEQVASIAKLARIQLNPDEASSLKSDLNEILAFVEQLSTAPTQDISPMAHPLGQAQPLRQDNVTQTNERERLQAIAPAVEAGLYLVPKVIE